MYIKIKKGEELMSSIPNQGLLMKRPLSLTNSNVKRQKLETPFEKKAHHITDGLYLKSYTIN